MGHLSLYRRYRPQSFADVVGQEPVTQTLRNAVLEGRVAHALLFSGPRGTGKTSTARILAKAINCEKGPATEPCNQCLSCVQITEGTSLDVVEIDAASHGSVDDARELREKVAYAPVAGKRKVYIYDECHMLTAAANNALLKILEEPPAHVVFVFATTEPHKVLPTLLDRCQRYEFRSIEPDVVTNLVNEICEAEGVAISEEAVGMIASRAAGSARDALTVVEQLLSFAGDKVAVEDVQTLLGSVPEEILFEAVDVIAERDAAGALLFTDGLIRSGRDIREFVRAMVDHLRSLFLILQAQAAQEILDVSDETLERLRAQSNRFDSAELLRLLDLSNEIQVTLRQAIEGRLALEIGFARMTRPDLHSAPASMVARIERLERLIGVEAESADRTAPSPQRKVQPPPVARTASKTDRPRRGPAPEAKPALQKSEVGDQAPPRPVSELDTEKVQQAWDVILQKVKTRKVSFGALLLPANPVAFIDGELVLEFGPRSAYHHEQAKDPAKQIPLIEAFYDTFGIRPTIRVVLNSTETPGSTAKGPTASTKTKPESPAGATIEDDDRGSQKDPVDLVKESFSAEVVEDQ